MEKIDNHNCAGICSQRYCDEVEEEFIVLSINGFEFLVGFCKKHVEEFEQNLWESKNA